MHEYFMSDDKQKTGFSEFLTQIFPILVSLIFWAYFFKLINAQRIYDKTFKQEETDEISFH